MNILYCGDSGVRQGIALSALSVCRHAGQPVRFYILTAGLGQHTAILQDFAAALQRVLNGSEGEKPQGQHRVILLNVTKAFAAELPTANLHSRFTPFCMLRLFADRVPEMPNRILYLDSDVLCRGDFSAFYRSNLEGVEMVGVPDRYGKWFFGNPLRHSYLNSGVLLLNMQEIRQSGLFARCRLLCQQKKMFMPDQTALNKLAVKKKAPAKYNAQGRFGAKAVFWHFTTWFRLFPYPKAVTVKPWQVQQLHDRLHIFEFDDLLTVLQNHQKELFS